MEGSGDLNQEYYEQFEDLNFKESNSLPLPISKISEQEEFKKKIRISFLEF